MGARFVDFFCSSERLEGTTDCVLEKFCEECLPLVLSLTTVGSKLPFAV